MIVNGYKIKIWQVIVSVGVVLGLIGGFFTMEDRWNQSDEVLAFWRFRDFLCRDDDLHWWRSWTWPGDSQAAELLDCNGYHGCVVRCLVLRLQVVS